MFHIKQLLNNSTTISWYILRKYATKLEFKTLRQKKDHYGGLFPDKLLNKKFKTPDYMYIANEAAAQVINKHLEPYFKQSSCDTIMEINPGIGAFTRRLLDNEEKFKKILLMESMDYFMNYLQELHTLYPDRVKVNLGDVVNMWKLVYQDKMDDGSRVQELLRDVPHREWEEDPNMLLFGVVGSYSFFKHLINSIIFHSGLYNLGRAEMYLALPPPIYLQLTCNNEIGYMIYRSNSILFQILFEHRFIALLPRHDFLPTQIEYKKRSKLTKVISIHADFLYLVRIVPRRDIFNYVAPEDLPALWYFVKQNCISRRNRIIPNLEKWVPGCGPRLIINAEGSVPSVLLYDDEDVDNLPQYSSPCYTINNRSFYSNMNIFTEFGELSISQMLTLFSSFRSWPEYKDSSFLESLENSMLKMDSESMSAEDNDLSTQEITEEEQTSQSDAQSDVSHSPSRHAKKSKTDK